jgi:hypothetical protein
MSRVVDDIAAAVKTDFPIKTSPDGHRWALPGRWPHDHRMG